MANQLTTSFKKYSNYSEKSSFSGLVIGAEKPVLEVEFNEIQQVMDTKLSRIAQLIGNIVMTVEGGSISFDGDTKALTVKNCIAVAGNFTVFIPSAVITLEEDTPVAYLRLEEKFVRGTDTLYEYGDLNTKTEMENPIIDQRVGVETSRRRVVECTLACASVLPATTDPQMCRFVQVGLMTKTEDTYTFAQSFTPSNFLSGLLSSFRAEILETVQEMIEASKPSQVINVRQKGATLICTITDLSGKTPDPSYDRYTKTLCVVLSELSASAEYKDETVFITIFNGSLVVDTSGVNASSLPLATRTTPGVVRVGTGINVDSGGTISSDAVTVSEAVANTAAELVLSQFQELSDGEVDTMFRN